MTASTSKAYQQRPFSLDRLEGLLKLEGVMWRHDVDESLEAALEMAKFEAERGVSATYYVMARSPFYNPLSHDAIRVVGAILKLGHRIGVHCDLGLPRNAHIAPANIAKLADVEHTILCDAFPTTIRLSLHCPPVSALWVDIPGFESAYAPEWEGRYYADSSTTGSRATAAFRHGDPEDDPRRPLQINLHPEHWFPHTKPVVEGFYR